MTDNITFYLILVIEDLFSLLIDELRRFVWRFSPKKSMVNAPLCHLRWSIANGTDQMRYAAWMEIDKRIDNLSLINTERIKDNYKFTYLYSKETDEQLDKLRDEVLERLHQHWVLSYDKIRERERRWKAIHGTPREREDLTRNE